MVIAQQYKYILELVATMQYTEIWWCKNLLEEIIYKDPVSILEFSSVV